MIEGKIVSWIKFEGDPVVVETFYSGFLDKILVPDGHSTSVGASIAFLAESPYEFAQAQSSSAPTVGSAAAGSESRIYNLFVQDTKDASSTWKLVDSEGSNQLAIKEPSVNVVLLDYISSGKWKEIVDFDDHLDDINKDWLNSEFFK